MAVRKSANIEVTAKTEGAARNLDKVAKSTAKMRNAAEAAGKSQEKMGKRISRLEASLERSGKSLRRFQNILGAGGLVATASLAISKFDEMVERSAKLQAVMGNLPIGIGAARTATQGMVNDFELAVAASRAVRLGVVENEEQFGKLAEVASKLGLSIGQDLGKSVEDLTIALGRQSPMILDNLGIQLKLSDAYREYAAQLGKTAKELTDLEKKQAFLTIGMQKAEEAASKVRIELDDGTQAWIRWKSEMQNISDTLFPAFLGGLAKVRNFLVDVNADILGFVDNIRESIELSQFSEEATKGRTSVRGFGGEGIASQKKEESEARRKTALEIEFETQKLLQLGEAKAKLRKQREAEKLKAFRDSQRSGRGGRRREIEDIESADRGLPSNEISDDIAARNEELRQQELERIRSFESAKAEIRLNTRLRAVENMRAEGVDPIMAIEAEKQAQLEFLEFKRESADSEVERMLVDDEIQAQLHQSRLARIAEETKAREDAKNKAANVLNTVTAVTKAHTAGLRTFADIAIKGEDRKAKAMAAAAGVDAVVQHALEVARAAAAFARYDFVGGAGHIAAAAAYAGAAVTAFREAGGGGGSAPSAAPTLGGGFGGGGAANQGPRTGGGLGPNTNGRVPTSIPTAGTQQAVAGGGQTGAGSARTVVLNIGEVRTFGETERESVGREIRELVSDADRTLGVA